jgi:hypothetical protein
MNAKMKVLALALLGLAGYAGSAAASCPSSPVPPWSVNAPFQGTTAIVPGGLDGSACRLDSAISAGASGFANAVVEDDTPTAEPRYRAQFMINVDALGAPTLLTSSYVFSATSSVSGTGINIGLFGDGSGGWRISYNFPNATDPSGISSGSVPLTAGSKHVEFDLPVGTGGTFGFWVENNVEASPDLSVANVNNSAIVGIDTAFLGLAAPSDSFIATYAGTAAQFDRFDSRRSSFIGF